MIEDVVAESRRLLEAARPESADDVRMAGRPLIAFSETMSAADGAIKQRLTGAVYRNRDVTQVMGRAETIVRRLFLHYVENPSAFPDGWRPRTGEDAFRVATDFLAGMTDRYAIAAYARFFDEAPDLRHGAVV
jgi:dGTPase